MFDFIHDMIWFGRKGHIRSHTFTRQFFRSDVSADAALTTIFDLKNETSAGIVQVVSDAGKENFAGGIGGSPSGYISVLPYKMTNLFRTGVTSVTCGLFGGDYARSRYVFIVKELEGESRSLVSDKKQFAVAYDPVNGAISHVHEVYGDASFIKKNGPLKQLRNFAGDAVKGKKLLAVPARFRIDPGAEFRVDVKTKTLRRIDK